MDIAQFKELPILGILRCNQDVAIEELIEISVEAGLKAFEVAMNSLDAAQLIARAAKASGGRISIGAGTVLNSSLLNQALDSGASFIVSPATFDEVIVKCAANHIPVFPGALTPQEICKAWELGATMVKVFPSSLLGPSYIKEIKGPFDKIELLACGGVSSDNIRKYFDCGASAVAFGASIFRREWLQNGDFPSIEKAITNLISAYNRRDIY